MTTRTLTDLREEMRAVARGERKPAPLPAREILNVLASSEHRSLLQILHRQRPDSVGQLVALTGRTQPSVSRSLQQLARHGLIELVREGREVRPVATVATVRINLADDTYDTAPAA